MRITIFTQVRNESYFIAKFLEHYAKFATVIHLFDHFSTDNTLEIAENMDLGKCTLHTYRDFGNPRGLDDTQMAEWKNNVWKRCPADWVIVCDADELLYHPNIIEYLQECKEKGITLPHIQGFQMYSMDDPIPDKPIIETHKFGVPSDLYSKNIIFCPQNITEINYTPGAHTCTPQGNVKKSDKPLYLLHYKFIGGYDRLIAHYAERNAFITSNNRYNGHSWHYGQSREKIILDFEEELKRSFQII